MNRDSLLQCLSSFLNATRNAFITAVEWGDFSSDEREKLDRVAGFLEAGFLVLSLLIRGDNVSIQQAELSKVDEVIDTTDS
jgi:hypothetical protein